MIHHITSYKQKLILLLVLLCFSFVFLPCIFVPIDHGSITTIIYLALFSFTFYYVLTDGFNRGWTLGVVILKALIAGLFTPLGLISYFIVRPGGNLVKCTYCAKKKLAKAAKCPHCEKVDERVVKT